MKHAYLIIAHNEFEVLQRLVKALDDSRNDIYVHIDRKVKVLPELHTESSNLYILKKRIDVRWGHVSQIETELLLFETALNNGPYERYNLISGVHLPIKSNDCILSYFAEHREEELLHLWPFDDFEANVKVRTKHFFLKGYRSSCAIVGRFSQYFWNFNLKFRKRMSLLQHRDKLYYKSDNWVSLTEKAVAFIVGNGKVIIKEYRNSFCGDEFFVATELLNNKEMFNVVDTDRLLFVDFVVGAPRDLNSNDEGAIQSSPCLFARKFNSKDIDFIQRILKSR